MMAFSVPYGFTHSGTPQPAFAIERFVKRYPAEVKGGGIGANFERRTGFRGGRYRSIPSDVDLRVSQVVGVVGRAVAEREDFPRRGANYDGRDAKIYSNDLSMFY